MGVRIVTDTAGIFPELTEELGIITVPIRVIIGGASNGTEQISCPGHRWGNYSQPSPGYVFSPSCRSREKTFCLTLREFLAALM